MALLEGVMPLQFGHINKKIKKNIKKKYGHISSTINICFISIFLLEPGNEFHSKRAHMPAPHQTLFA